MSTSTLSSRRRWFSALFPYPRKATPKPVVDDYSGDLQRLARLSRLCWIAARDGGVVDTAAPVELTGWSVVLDKVWAEFAAELSEFEQLEIRVAA